MKASFKIIWIFTITWIFVDSSPRFGDRIVKDVSNTSLINKVFRPSQIKVKNQNGLDNGLNLNDNKVKYDNNGVSVNTTQNSYNHQIERNATLLIDQKNDRIGQIIDEESLRYPSEPDFSTFNMAIEEVPDLASSEQIIGPPIPPPPPKLPHQLMPNFESYHPYSNQDNSYDESRNEQNFDESTPKHIANDYSLNIPQGFPPKGFPPPNDPRADFKKKLMGTENNRGRPWGTKTSYTYKDPDNPNNFMEMSEVRLSVTREMNPQEAQSQVHKFLEAAQNGQYGPLSPIIVDQTNDDQNYKMDSSHLSPSEPLEPTEPNFPNF